MSTIPKPKKRPPAPSELEIQLGHGRSKEKDDRIKRVVRRHPQRDEPKVDSVEKYETPER